MKTAILLAAVLLLAGCIQTETRAAYRVSGQVAGQPADLVVQGGSASDTGADPAAAVAAVVGTLRGDLAQVAAAIKAQPPPAPPVPAADIAAAVVKAAPQPDNTPLYAAGGTAIAGLLAALFQARKAAADHKADADDAWDRLAPPTPKV